ncbi:MAG: nitrite/sulfite reductase [Alphaproteobacteria bacterium]
MYSYETHDRQLVRERVSQFRDQVQRRLDGALSEDEFRPLRLRNGLYLELLGYMLRAEIPYGLLSSRQMRMLAHIARTYDRGYAHFTTRQNIQYNWPRLEDVPDILELLADVDMHAIQTSGSCVRNITTDHLAGIAPDEIEDPRPWCELVRQWSSLHPEFSFLPRKFKIAITGSPSDRAAVRVHDVGLRMVRAENGEVGFEVWVGGGLGRTPMIGQVIRSFLPKNDILSYLEAILRVYNLEGRRDHLFKSRIKILVQSLGLDRLRELVEAEWAATRDGALSGAEAEVARIRARFAAPPLEVLPASDPGFAEARLTDPAFARWVGTNVAPHRVPGHALVTLSLKPIGQPPGDLTADQMDGVAELADTFSLGRIRVSHHQNLVLPDVRQGDLPALWRRLEALGLATPNVGRATDIIACPGLDYCALAYARSIPIAQRISERLAVFDADRDLGELQINISGCVNACGHHHVGHIGILGVDKCGEEAYQITVGGSSADDCSIGEVIGPALTADEVVDAVEAVVVVYLGLRRHGERFLDTWRRMGPAPFKETIHAAD